MICEVCGKVVRVTNMGVKKFHFLLRNKSGKHDFEVYQVVEDEKIVSSKVDKRLDELLLKMK